MYIEKELAKIAKRDNNTKRNYLVVNPLQGKHVPSTASSALAMFQKLAVQIKAAYPKETLLLIGFAETATAIGAAVAGALNCLYIQTTREQLFNVDYLFFSEEHSHATEQKLVKNDINTVINEIDRIVFIEDEVTTGNTILNFITVLINEYPQMKNYAVASLLNGMNEESLKIYHDKGIALYYLVKTNHNQYAEIANSFLCDGNYIHAADKNSELGTVNFYNICSYMDTRRLTKSQDYLDKNLDLWKAISQEIDFQPFDSILVIGTEEFMYPALFIANMIEETGKNVKCHSTTRSPISVSKDENYPLHVRYELFSLYNENRITYIYDLEQYDCVIIITDSNNGNKNGIVSLINALQMKNNANIHVVRWCKS